MPLCNLVNLHNFYAIIYNIGEYQQNLCYNDPSCQPCLSRLPSCVGKQDGLQVFTGKLWTDLYVKCQQNRTISVEHCPQNQVFDPHSRQCVNTKTISKLHLYKH